MHRCDPNRSSQSDGELGLQDLPAHVLRQVAAQESRSSDGVASSSGLHNLTPEQSSVYVKLNLDATGWSLSRVLGECEREVLMAAMARAGGNQTEAARLLDISVRSVYTKLQKHQTAICRQ
jgi:transcriptional regulator of acetoin/glycerol metabolism